MQSLQRGFAFFKQAWQIAFADKDLLKPSIYAMFAGFAVSVVMLIPMIILGVIFSGSTESGFGRTVFGIMGALMIFIQYVVGYIFSAMTVYLVYGHLTEGDGVMSKAWTIVKRDFWDIVSLAAASTAVKLLRNFLENKGRNVGGGMFSSVLGTLWTETAFLVLPVMVIEDVNLPNGLKRVGQIAKDNLLLIGVSTVGVGVVTGIIGFLLGATGIGLGLGVGLGIVSASGQSVLGLAGGITLGVLIASVFIMAATVISSYTSTAYHTCLYLWVRDTEKARQSGQSLASVSAPAPLASVLQ